MSSRKRRGRPPKSPKARKDKKTALANTDANCKECDQIITEDTSAIECEICETYVCLPCANISEDVYKFLVEKEVEMPYLCSSCKEEIPKVRELMGLRASYIELSEEVEKLRTDMTTQELKIKNYEENLQTMENRLKKLESRPIANPNDFPGLLETIQPGQPPSRQVHQFIQNHVIPVIQPEISEFDKIQEIKLNLVCSGIAESNQTGPEADVEDRTAFINLIQDEFNIVPDVEKVERCGKKKPPTEGQVPEPRLLKIFMKDQRTRKLILSKAVSLRNSDSEHVKTKVFIRPDQTLKQQEQSKNLRLELKLKRDRNPGKTYKIYRGAVIEVTPAPAPEETAPAPEETGAADQE